MNKIEAMYAVAALCIGAGGGLFGWMVATLAAHWGWGHR